MAKKRSNVTKQSGLPKWLPLGVVGMVALVAGVMFLGGGDGKKREEVPVVAAASFSPVRTCKVFIENSGSMDGYVGAVNSQLKSDLNALLSNIMTLKREGMPLVDSIALHYINSDVIPLKGVKVSAFTEGLSVTAFQQGGGERGTTSLQDLMARVQQATGKGEVSILVSDMILALSNGQSPASISTNIETLLRSQLADRADWSVVVWRMLSDFEGTYYQTGGKGTVWLTGVQRPYYIIFMGDREQLRTLLAEGQLPDNLPLLSRRTHRLSLEAKTHEVDYHIAPKAIVGSLNIDRQDKHSIASAERGTGKDGRRGFAFDLMLKRPALLQAKQDLLEVGNYALTPEGYQVTAVKEQGEHLKLRIEGEGVIRGDFQLSYIQKSPTWFDEVHAEQNSDIRASSAMKQTYGIRYILEGLLRPYETEAKQVFTLKFSIR